MPRPSSQSQIDESRVRSRVILLQRSTELADCADMLADLAVPTESCTTGLPTDEQLEGACLLIASAQRLLELGPPHLSRWPRTITVVQDASKTLTSHLGRVGVSMILCRPLHLRALRLLLLHEVYHGPERRNRRRTLIGHHVRAGSGVFKKRGTLLELSPSGARIQIPGMPKLGDRLCVRFGRELTHGRPLKVSARVVRCIDRGSRSGRAECEVGLSILDAKRHHDAIAAILDRFEFAPPPWRDDTVSATPAPKTEQRREPEPPPISVLPPAIEPETPTEREAPPPPDITGEGDDSRDEDRRQDPRIVYDRRIVALGEEAARVLVGRDLSARGMRIEPNPSVAVGDEFRVALHCGMRIEPLILTVRALRQDGSEGIVLGFENLEPSHEEQLEEIISSSRPIRDASPAVGSTRSEVGDALVIGEMLDRIQRGEMGDLGQAESDEIDSPSPEAQ